MPKPTPLSRLRPPRPTELRYWRDGGWCYYPNTGPMKNSKKKSNKKKMPPPAPTPDIREAMRMTAWQVRATAHAHADARCSAA